MHSRMLATINIDDADESSKARHLIYDRLLAEGFTEGGGHWPEGACDWFVIGGRWSGDLNDPVTQKMLESVEGERDSYNEYGYEDDAKIVTDEIWERLFRSYYEGSAAEKYADIWDANDNAPVTDKESLVGKKWVVVVDYHT